MAHPEYMIDPSKLAEAADLGRGSAWNKHYSLNPNGEDGPQINQKTASLEFAKEIGADAIPMSEPLQELPQILTAVESYFNTHIDPDELVAIKRLRLDSAEDLKTIRQTLAGIRHDLMMFDRILNSKLGESRGAISQRFIDTLKQVTVCRNETTEFMEVVDGLIENLPVIETPSASEAAVKVSRGEERKPTSIVDRLRMLKRAILNPQAIGAGSLLLSSASFPVLTNQVAAEIQQASSIRPSFAVLNELKATLESYKLGNPQTPRGNNAPDPTGTGRDADWISQRLEQAGGYFRSPDVKENAQVVVEVITAETSYHIDQKALASLLPIMVDEQGVPLKTLPKKGVFLNLKDDKTINQFIDALNSRLGQNTDLVVNTLDMLNAVIMGRKAGDGALALRVEIVLTPDGGANVIPQLLCTEKIPLQGGGEVRVDAIIAQNAALNPLEFQGQRYPGSVITSVDVNLIRKTVTDWAVANNKPVPKFPDSGNVLVEGVEQGGKLVGLFQVATESGSLVMVNTKASAPEQAVALQPTATPDAESTEVPQQVMFKIAPEGSGSFDSSATYSISKDGKTVLKNGEPLAEIVPLPESVKINIKGGDPRPEKGIHPKDGVYDLYPSADGRTGIATVGTVVGFGVDEATGLPCAYVVVSRKGMSNLNMKLVSNGKVSMTGSAPMTWEKFKSAVKEGQQVLFTSAPNYTDDQLQQIADYWAPRGFVLKIEDLKKWNSIAQVGDAKSLLAVQNDEWVAYPFNGVGGVSSK